MELEQFLFISDPGQSGENPDVQEVLLEDNLGKDEDQANQRRYYKSYDGGVIFLFYIVNETQSNIYYNKIRFSWLEWHISFV